MAKNGKRREIEMSEARIQILKKDLAMYEKRKRALENRLAKGDGKLTELETEIRDVQKKIYTFGDLIAVESDRLSKLR